MNLQDHGMSSQSGSASALPLWSHGISSATAPTRTAQPKATSALRRLTPIHWAVGALILISIGRAHDHISILAAVRPALLLTAFCLLIAVVRPQAIRLQNLTAAWPPKAIGALFATSLISAVLGISFAASASFILTSYLPILTLFALTIIVVREVNDLRWLFTTYIISVLVVSFASIFLAQPIYFDGAVRQGGAGMYDGNDIGVVLMVGLPIAVILLRSKQRVLMLLAALAILGTLASLVLAASRGGFLGMMVGGAAILALSPGLKAPNKILIAATAAASFLLLAPENYRSQMSTLLNPQADYNVTSETGRLAIWTRGLGYVSEYPIFGIGPNNFIRAGWTISPQGQAGLFGASLRDQAPHNSFLQVWAEMGSVGLLIWLSILSFGVVYPLILRRRMPRRWLDGGSSDQRFIYLSASYLPASFLGFAVTSFFVSHGYTAIFYVMVGLLTGFLVMAHGQKRAMRVANRFAKGPTAARMQRQTWQSAHSTNGNPQLSQPIVDPLWSRPNKPPTLRQEMTS